MKDITKKDSAIIKGIAILILMCHHNFRKAGLFQGYEISFWPFTQNFIIDISYFFKISVGIFLFVSGYGLTLSYQSRNKDYLLTKKDYTSWVVQRLFKLLSGFWFVFVIMSIICQLLNGRTWDIYFSEGILYGIFQYIVSFLGLARLFEMPNLVYTWWYMSAAVMAVVIVPILNYIAKNKVGYTGSFLLLWLIPHFIGLEYQGDTKPFTYILVLFLGCACAENKLFSKVKAWRCNIHSGVWKVIKWIAALIVLVICFKEYAVFLKEGQWEIALNIIPFVITYLCYEYICPIPYLDNILEYIGNHSLNIFLIHTFIRGVYLADFIYSWRHFMVVNMILLGMSIAASYIVEYLKKLVKYDIFIEKVSRTCVDLLCKGDFDE